MDDKAVGINNGESVIRLVNYMMMIRPYVSGISRRCTSCCWYSLFAKFQIFAAFLRFLRNFRSFSNGQKARKPRSATFFNITLRGDFFQQKKNWFWELRRVSMAIVTCCLRYHSRTFSAHKFLPTHFVIFILNLISFA